MFKLYLNFKKNSQVLRPLGAARRQQKNIYACNFNDPQGYISKDSRTGNGGRLVKFESRARRNDRLVVFYCAGINRTWYDAKGNIRLIFDERLDKQGTARKRPLIRYFGVRLYLVLQASTCLGF